MNFLAQFMNQRVDFYFNVGAALLNLGTTLFNLIFNPHPVPLSVALTASCFVFSSLIALTVWKKVEPK